MRLFSTHTRSAVAALAVAGPLLTPPLARLAPAPDPTPTPRIATSNLPVSEPGAKSGTADPTSPAGLDPFEAAWPTAEDVIERAEEEDAAPGIVLEDGDGLRQQDAIAVDGIGEQVPAVDVPGGAPPLPSTSGGAPGSP